MSLIQSTAIPSSATGYKIEQSLRFDKASATNLTRTPATAGNRKTWTWSGWVKRGNLGATTAEISLFAAYPSSSQNNTNVVQFGFLDNDKFQVGLQTDYVINTTQVFRDISAWYHIILVFDTTQATATNRCKLYVNGAEVTSFSADNRTDSFFARNADRGINLNGTPHHIGMLNSNWYMDGYMGEINFIDGQALTPADFGETSTYGEWKPKEYSGSYGTNGFYLPFKQDYTVEGFSAVTYTGTGAAQYIGGVGFQPDFAWVKKRSEAGWHHLFDAIRGAQYPLYSNETDSRNHSPQSLKSFETDGFTLGTAGGVSGDSPPVSGVAWNWDMGGSNATNTQGSIQSTVRANTTYGQSIVSFTGTGSSATVGHGLSSKPSVVLTKRRDASGHWLINDWSADYVNKLKLNDTEVASSSNNFVNDASATTFTLGTDTDVNADDGTYISYCWNEVSGYSKFGTYNGTGSTHTVTLGFAPAFVMLKSTDATHPWVMLDNVRQATGNKKEIYANTAAAEGDNSSVFFTSTGFQITTDNSYTNQSGKKFIYMAFADKREYAYWLDQSGNNNDWTSNNLTESDVMVDSPTNNFCTLNVLDASATTTEGNLKTVANSAWKNIRGTMFVSSGKWYWESVKTSTASVYTQNGAATSVPSLGEDYGDAQNGLFVYSARNGSKVGQGTAPTGYGDSYATGDVIGVALDMDNGTIKFYKNNTIQNSGTAAFTGITGDVAPWMSSYNNTMVANFGQDSSFAGNKTAQGNQDGNNIGDFFYAPPTGFLALCTSNLPAVAVVPSENFNVVTYTGTGSSNTQNADGITGGVDFLWTKCRSHAKDHILVNDIIGGNTNLSTNTTTGDNTNANRSITLADSSFTLNSNSGHLNEANKTYVSWLWKAGGNGTAVPESGSGNNCVNASTHSANADAGFSIVKYVGRKDELSNGQHSKVTHGMGSNRPELIIIKNRDATDDWMVIGDALNTSSDWDHRHLNLNNTAAISGSDYTGSTVSNSTYFFISNADSVNTTDEKFIAYCFASVEGYSKVGTYKGNGNADGTFVYTGFRPAWVLIKPTSRTGNWMIANNKSSPSNVVDKVIFANTSAGEYTDPNADCKKDFLSNGFKIYTTDDNTNENNATYVYIAFAETPFKFSNAR